MPDEPLLADFEQWVTPGDLLERFEPAGDLEGRKRAIIRRLAAGELRAAGRGDNGLAPIRDWLWRDWRVGDADLWTVGDVSFSIGGMSAGPRVFSEGRDLNPPKPYQSASFRGVRLDPANFREAFDLPEVVQETAAIPAAKKGGKPAGHHGEPIAATTKRLLLLTDEELQAYKPHVLTGELIKEYERCGATPPSGENAAKIASGILKVLRN